MEMQRPHNKPKTTLKKNKVGKFMLPDFKTCSKATAMKYQHKERRIDEWNRIESSNVDPNIWIPRYLVKHDSACFYEDVFG